jgi:hypothetical protein
MAFIKITPRKKLDSKFASEKSNLINQHLKSRPELVNVDRGNLADVKLVSLQSSSRKMELLKSATLNLAWDRSQVLNSTLKSSVREKIAPINEENRNCASDRRAPVKTAKLKLDLVSRDSVKLAPVKLAPSKS